MVSGVCSGLDGEPAAGLDTHRPGVYPTSCWPLVGHVGINPGFQGAGAQPQMIMCRASPLFAREMRPRRPPNAMISADGVIKRVISQSANRRRRRMHFFT